MTINEHAPVQNHFDTFTIAVDFDGTLAIGTTLAPNKPLIDMLIRCEDRGYGIVIASARPPAHHDLVKRWLADNIDADWPVMLGVKPAADLFIDDRGLLPSLDVLESYIERVAHQRSMLALTLGHDTGPLSLEIGDNFENPDHRVGITEEDFQVVVPVSGGVDSTTCWAMAVRAGFPVRPVYVDTGAAYSDAEMFHVERLSSLVGGDAVERIQLDVEYERWQYIDRGRNSVIVFALADLMRTAQKWGEIWFGAVAEWAETPVRGGDQSVRWMLTMQQLLTLEGHDVRLTTPLGGMGKADAVGWMLDNDMRDAILATRSCYADGTASCGRCRSCFRRWLAFERHGLNNFTSQAWGNATLDFSEQAKQFVDEESDRRRNDEPRADWSPGRVSGPLEYAWRWL